MPDVPSRRTFLGLTATSGISTLAGCENILGSDDDTNSSKPSTSSSGSSTTTYNAIGELTREEDDILTRYS